MSVRDDLDARLKAIRAGCDGYLVKPVSLVDLLDLLDRLTDREMPDKYRVLIVDDDPEIAGFYAAMLGDAEVETVVVTDPLAVMEPLREMRPDLILMDIRMPGCDGFELSAVIRQDRAFVQVPIVFLTASKVDDAWLRAIQAGGDEFINKSQPPREVVTLILARLKRARDLSSVIARLRTSETRFRAVVETAGEAIVTANDAGRIIFWNSAAEKMFGYRASEILGQQVSRLVPERHRRRHQSGFGRIVAGSAPSLGSATLDPEAVAKDGHEIAVEISVADWRAGDQLYLTAVIRDVSERNEVERRVRDSEERYRRIAEVSSDWVWEMDAGFRYSYFSAGFQRLTGIDPKFALGKTREKLTKDALHSEAWRKHRVDVTVGRDFRNFQYHFLGPDGTRRIFSESGSPIFDERGAVAGYRGTCTDITELEEARNLLVLAKQDAEAANKAKSAFLSSMSHELRTPLNAILGFSQLMIEYPDAPLSEEQREFIGHIRDSGKLLLELVNEVLDLARIEAGEVRMSWEAVSLGDLVESCLPMIESIAEERSITVSMRNRIDRPVRADRSRLMQVLLNLLSNAAKYNRDGGSVIVEMREKDDETLRLSVIDTGLGIPDDRRDDVFRPFNRLGAEETEIEGTGVGLTVTKQLIERMGGRIGYVSVPDQGSTFWIELPFSNK